MQINKHHNANLLLMLLLAAALNLSWHAMVPVLPTQQILSNTIISEQSVDFVPFNARENTIPSQFTYCLPVFSLASNLSNWMPLNSQKQSLKLLDRHTLSYPHEYPFIILIRKLRI